MFIPKYIQKSYSEIEPRTKEGQNLTLWKPTFHSNSIVQKVFRDNLSQFSQPPSRTKVLPRVLSWERGTRL